MRKASHNIRTHKSKQILFQFVLGLLTNLTRILKYFCLFFFGGGGGGGFLGLLGFVCSL
jgi:hypothetical protein